VEIINKPFLGIISATKINSKKRRAMLSHLPVKFAFFAISAILLLSGFIAIHSNQSAWAGTFPGPNGQIAFVRGPHPGLEIYVMNSDGSGQTGLTDNTEPDKDPSWSPDGEKIAFGRESPEENFEIWVMNSDGSGQTRLTDNGFAQDPSWSPDGEKIAFSSVSGGIFVVNAADGSDVTRLTTDGREPSWSPDGEKIAFTSDRDGNDEIYVMNAAGGSGQTRLTDNDAPDFEPSWSPDGEKIAFVSDIGSEGSTNDEIYVMNAADGSDVTRLTNNNVVFEFSPDWGTNTSPAGGDGSPTPSEQAIEEAISTIQNLDSIPQGLKTSLIALLRQVLDSLNDDTTITTNNFNVP